MSSIIRFETSIPLIDLLFFTGLTDPARMVFANLLAISSPKKPFLAVRLSWAETRSVRFWPVLTI